MSSLETTAAPWRSNACRSSLFPAPIPPVTATETGREDLGLLVVLRLDGRLGLGLIARVLVLERDCLVGSLGRSGILGRGILGCRLFGQRRVFGLGRLDRFFERGSFLGSRQILREDFLREAERLSRRSRRAVVALLDPIRLRYGELRGNPAVLRALLAEGAANAELIAAETLEAAYDRVGFVAP